MKKISDLINQKLSRIDKGFSKLFLGASRYQTGEEGKIDLEHFRNKVFYKLAILFITIGLFPICYGAYLFFQENNIIAGALELSSYIFIVILFLSSRITILKKRNIFVLCIYLLGLMLLFVVGPMGAGLLVIYSAFGLAACLLNIRQNIIFIFISLLVFIVISVLFHLALLDNLAIYRYRESWYIVAISTQSMGTLFVLIINNLFSNTEKQMEEIGNSAKLIIESERSKAVLISNIPGMAYRCKYDRDWTMQFVSNGCFKLTGYTPERLIDNKELSFNDLITPECREPVWKEWERILAERLPFKYEYEITTINGERKWVLELAEGVYRENGEVEALEGIILDISDRKENENNLKYINEHDGWTGLYNREYLERILENDSKVQNTLKRAVISINLSAVQSLTSHYGFHYTQNLIKKTSEALEQYCSVKRMLFKTYENRFVLYLRDYKDKNELIELSEALSDTLVEIFVTDRISGGIGIIEIDLNNELDVDLLLKKLLIASEKSINIFDKDFIVCFYDDALDAEIKREGDIRQELSRIAIEENTGELFLKYQPILDLRTDSICGFEALARLKTEKLGFVSPLEFIPIAEKTKLIIPIGEKIMIDAFHFINRLNRQGYDAISVSINVSAIQLLRPEFADSLFELINRMQVNPENIGIEITESIFSTDYIEINNIISRLRDAGLQIAIDDFGKGYSSLAREKELNVDCLKIDKCFIDKLLEKDIEKAITGDIISIAHRLGHCAVAEGVEYIEQKQYLLAQGCDKIQGYLIAEPLDAEAAIEMLGKQNIIDDECN